MHFHNLPKAEYLDSEKKSMITSNCVIQLPTQKPPDRSCNFNYRKYNVISLFVLHMYVICENLSQCSKVFKQLSKLELIVEMHGYRFIRKAQ